MKNSPHTKSDDGDLMFDGDEFRAVLRSVPLVNSVWHKTQVVLHFDEGDAVFVVAGMTFRVRMLGNFAGQVRFPFVLLQSLSAHPPERTTVGMQVQGGRIRIDTSSADCFCDAATSSPIRLPMNLSLLIALSVPHHYNATEIESAGLTPLVEYALQVRDDSIREALHHLEKLEVTREEMQALINGKMERMPKP